MLQDITESYTRAVEQDMNIVLNHYTCKEGLYLRLDLGQPIDSITDQSYIIIDRKEDVLATQLEQIKWFKRRDYYSVVINDDMNKCIDLPAKKIHSTNGFTLFIKKDIFPAIGKKKDTFTINQWKEHIEKFYGACKNASKKLESMCPKIKGSSKERASYTKQFMDTYFYDEQQYLESEYRQHLLGACKGYILENWEAIIQKIQQIDEKKTLKNYIKIFIDVDETLYKQEHEIYIGARIFNVNDYNIVDKGEILGLPSTDMSTNSKKPYLVNRSMRSYVPCRRTILEVTHTKSFYDWLKNQKQWQGLQLEYEYNYKGQDTYTNSPSFYVIHHNGESIDGFDNIPTRMPELYFEVENITYVPKYNEKMKRYEEDSYEENYIVSSQEQLQTLISRYYFKKQLQGYYKTNDPSISANFFTGELKVLFLGTRDAFYDFFYKGINTSMVKILDQVTLKSIVEQLRHTVKGLEINELRRAYNLRIALLENFKIKGGREMSIMVKKLPGILITKFNSEEQSYFENDTEFYYAVGQVVYYLLSQSKSQNKNYGMFEMFLNNKNSKHLIRRVKETFNTYKHAVAIGNKAFNQAMAMIMAYQPEEIITDQMQSILLAGIFSKSLLYRTKDKGGVKDEE